MLSCVDIAVRWPPVFQAMGAAPHPNNAPPLFQVLVVPELSKTPPSLFINRLSQASIDTPWGDYRGVVFTAKTSNILNA